MRILPVLDLLSGIVVRGVAGRRAEYRPVESVLTDTPTAGAVARAFRERLGLDTLYIADLDAILHDRPNPSLYRELFREGFKLLVDAGVRDASRARAVLDTAAAAVIGLETLPDVTVLEQLTQDLGADRILFSLDLADGRPLGDTTSWRSDDPFEMALEAHERGIRRIIVLDLAAVGVGAGVPTVALCRRLHAAVPDLRLITGGGVRGPADVQQLAPLGLDGVLVASALHDGRLAREHLK